MATVISSSDAAGPRTSSDRLPAGPTYRQPGVSWFSWLKGTALSAALRDLVKSRQFFVCLTWILPITGAIIGVDVARRSIEIAGTGTLPVSLSLDQEFGIGECFEYLLTACSAAAMLMLLVNTKAWMFGVAALLFAYLTFDNAFAVHEQLGHVLAPLFPVSQGAAQQAGEMTVFAFVGLLTLAGALLSLSHGSRRENALGGLVLLATAATAIFGVGFDALHMVASSGEAHRLLGSARQMVDAALAVVEDGGEQVVLSIAAAVSLTANRLLADTA